MLKFKFRFLLVFLVLLFSFFSINAYNSSWTDLYVKANGWCIGMDTKFIVYNKTQYENKEYIESNLCGINETPEDDDCEEFDIIEADIEVFKGPMDGLPLLFSGELDSNSEFKVNFPEPNSYLIKITPNSGDYNDFENNFDFIECTHSDFEVEEKVEYYNLSINDEKDKLHISLINSNINDESKIKIIKIEDFKLAKLPNLNNSYLTYSITSNEINFTSMVLLFKNSVLENHEIQVYKYNKEKKSWNKLDSVLISSNNIEVNSDSFGIYSIVEIPKKEEPIKEEIKEEVKEEKVTQNNNENYDNLEIANESSNKSYLVWIFIIFILIVGAGIFIVINKDSGKSKSNPDSSYGKEKEEPKILTSYNQTYSQAKDYVQKYKNDYSRDQIFRALKSANIPEDIINKVFLEEF